VIAIIRTLIYTVVPANAGTHKPQAFIVARKPSTSIFQNDRRGVWVPAFAGTTGIWRGGALGLSDAESVIAINSYSTLRRRPCERRDP